MYWRLSDNYMSYAHGTAKTQQGVADQIQAFLASVELDKISDRELTGNPIILTIQREDRQSN